MAARTGAMPSGLVVASQTGRLVLALIAAAQFVLQVDFSIVNVAIPTIERELQVTAASLQWIVTGYSLTFGSLLLTGARIGDLVGRRRLLLVGLTAFGLASISAGLAPSLLVLIISRFVQGSSAALVAPSALALLQQLFSDPSQRAQALGFFQGSTAAGATAGIVLGGVLTQAFSWRAIFLVNPPIIVVLTFLALRLLPKDERRSAGQPRGRVDVPGATLITASLASLIFGFSEGEQHGLTAPQPLMAIALAAVLFALFVVVERRSSSPMVPFAIFYDAARRASLMVMLLVGAVLAAYVYFNSLYLQDVLHYSALQTGAGLIPATLTTMLTSTILARRLLSRLGIKRVLLIGLVCAGLGQLWLSRVSANGTYLVNVLPGILVTAFGLGSTIPTISFAITNGVTRAQQGVAGALFVTAQQVGAATGLAVLASLAASRTQAMHGSLVAGYQLSYLLGAGIVAIAIVLVLTQLRAGSRGSQSARTPGPSTTGRA
jgi:EmrB/QacA subfamily drug resistance transporter